MLGVTKFMQNERFIQCPLSLIWSVIFVQDSRSTLQYSLEIVSFLYSWHVMEDIWVQLSVQRWEAWPALSRLACNNAEIFVTGCTWPRNIPARSVNWVQGAASDNETGFRILMWLGLKRRSSDSSSFSYAKFTHMDHFRKVVDCEEAELIFNCIDSLFLWKS